MRGLVVRLTALGDVVLSTALPRAIRARHPSATIELLTDHRYAPFMSRASEFDRVVPYDRQGTDRGLGGVSHVLERLGPEPFDFVVDLQGKLRTRTLVMRLNSGRKMTLTKRTPWSAFLSVFGHDPPVRNVHTVDLYLRAISRLEPGVAHPFLRRADVPRAKRLGISVGASHATKLWSTDKFVELTREVRRTFPDWEVVPIGGPADQLATNAIAEVVGGRTDVGTLDVEGLWEVLSGLDVFVGVDSGPTHIAAALGVKVVALFGPTSPVRWGPRGEGHRIIAPTLDCAPCSNTGGPICPIGTHACLKDLSVATVFREVSLCLATWR